MKLKLLLLLLFAVLVASGVEAVNFAQVNPIMTDENSPFGSIVSLNPNTYDVGDPAQNTMTSSTTDVARMTTPAFPIITQWVVNSTGNGVIVRNVTYGVRTNSISANTILKDFCLYGSFDNVTWVELVCKTGETGWGVGERRSVNFDNEVNYSIYNFNVTDNNGDTGFFNFAFLRYFRDEDFVPSGPENADPSLEITLTDLYDGSNINNASVTVFNSTFLPICLL